MLGGQPLAPHTPAELHNWDTVEIAGHAIILLEDVDVAERKEPPPAAVAPSPATVAERALIVSPPTEAAVAPPRRAPSQLLTRPLDRSDDAIVMELSEREWTVDVTQVVTCQVYGDELVYSFKPCASHSARARACNSSTASREVISSR